MVSDKTLSWEKYAVEYGEFQEDENIPVHEGLYIDDARSVEVDHWDRTGGRGAFVNLDGFQYTCDIHLHEIPTGQQLKPQRHLFESIVFVARGRGATQLGEEGDETAFEWQQGSLFCLPRNTRYVHSNIGDTPARLVAVTTLPLLYNLLKDDELIWELDCYDQLSLESEKEDFYSSVDEVTEEVDERSVTRTSWESNFIPDVLSFDKLRDRPDRGGFQTVYFPFHSVNMRGKIGDYVPQDYVKAHAHLASATLIAFPGSEGSYSLFWEKGQETDERIRVDWEPFQICSPPTLWYHQHFNPTPTPSRYLVIYGPPQNSGLNVGQVRPTNNEIEFEDEDEEIKEIFEREVEKHRE